MGSAIITAIKSGLGLMSDICKEFLSGFTTLFWVAPTESGGTGSLTVLGEYALVFLGIAITFSVVKLCLNLIRTNTGI
jgi:hypothetical protein